MWYHAAAVFYWDISSQSTGISLIASHSNANFSLVVQFFVKFHIALIQILLVWLLQNFAHVWTATLSWHVQNFVAILSPETEKYKRVVLQNFNFESKIMSEMDLESILYSVTRTGKCNVQTLYSSQDNRETAIRTRMQRQRQKLLTSPNFHGNQEPSQNALQFSSAADYHIGLDKIGFGGKWQQWTFFILNYSIYIDLSWGGALLNPFHTELFWGNMTIYFLFLSFP